MTKKIVGYTNRLPVWRGTGITRTLLNHPIENALHIWQENIGDTYKVEITITKLPKKKKKK